MARIIVVTSGKGGVGKTTSSAAIATGLAQKGKKTVVIDFDIGLRNLDLIMGCERRVVYDFVNVIQGDATQADIKIYHDSFLSLLGQTSGDGRAGGCLTNTPFARSNNNNACHRNSLLKRDQFNG